MAGGRFRNGISRILVVLWVGLLGADRVDLMGGRGGFVFTPFFLLTPVFLSWEGLWALADPRSVRVSRGLLFYSAILLALLGVVFLSTFFALDTSVSTRRASHLAFIALGTLGVAVVLWAFQAETRSSLVLGAGLGLALAVIFDLAEIWALASGVLEPISLGPISVELSVQMYQGTLPRLSGQVADPNRGGFLFLIYLFLVSRWARRGVSRWLGLWLGSLLILSTLSRSAVLAAASAAILAAVMSAPLRIHRAAVMSALALGALALTILLTNPRAPGDAGRFLAPAAARASLEEGSAREHFHLMARGWEEATASWQRPLVGLGYGNSFVVLQDIFPGNKYGNFHSLYLTFLAESGLPAVVLVLLLLGGPLVRWSPWTPLVAGAVVFNLFYQSAAEPAFWFLLAMAWAWAGVGGGECACEAPDT